LLASGRAQTRREPAQQGLGLAADAAADEQHRDEQRASTYAGAMDDRDVSFTTLDYEHSERFQTLRRELGVEAFGLNLILLAPRERGRIHSHDHQEEVYLVLAGELTLIVERTEHVLGEKHLARVGARARRQLVNTGPEPLVLLALGAAGEHAGRDGCAWESWDEPGLGRPPAEIPLPADLPPG
jgi:mannose-6-phosphate isomerase-like protein (cupin superfamily)